MCVGKEIMSESADLEPALKRQKIANETKEPARKIELLPHQIVHHAHKILLALAVVLAVLVHTNVALRLYWQTLKKM
jgi:hypothetical protein